MTSIPTFQIRHFLPPAVLDFHSSPARGLRFQRSPSFLLAPSPSPSPPSPPAVPRAAAGDDPNPGESPGADEEAAAPVDSDFESRLSQVRLKYRSGSGKKAEQRRAKKNPGAASSAKKGGGKGGAVMLPPIPLREPTTVGGLKVDFGFTPYSEHLNGRLAALGLAALVLVELGSGKGLLSFHTPAVIFIQIYTVAAASALFVKFEKERISVWPKAPPPSPGSVVGE